ncbi:MAG: Vms1/Ankzf1 family peptidyl-tRNA hydrolase [Carbonactinosporaceae bacterium]
MTHATISGADEAGLRAVFQAADTWGAVASVYLGRTPGALRDPDLELRWHAMTGSLAGHGVDEPTLDALHRRVMAGPAGSDGIAMFAAAGDVLFARETPGSGHADRAVGGRLPHVLPLLAWMQRRPPHVVVTVDRRGAELVSVRRGQASGETVTVYGPDDEIERNRPGGWSQPRYQHRAEDSWLHNAATVADAVARALRRVRARLLVLAGDVRARQLLEEHLGAAFRRHVVIRHVTGGRAPDGSQAIHAAEVAEAVTGIAEDETAGLLDRLAEGRGPDGRTVEGVRPTLDALAQGRVSTLFVVDDPGDERVAWFGPGTCRLAERPDAPSVVGARPTGARLTDAAVGAALLTRAGVRVLAPGSAHAPAEAIGALCRFRVPPAGS